MQNLCFIDIETTGTVFNFHEIIEIAANKTSFNGKNVVGNWRKRFKPEYPERITETAKRINNYSTENWKNSEPQSREIWNSAIEFWGDCTPICHNPSFERAFITIALLNFGIKEIEMDYHWIGTESLAWPLYTKGRIPKLSLSSLLKYYGFKPEPKPHTAMNGASACRNVYLELLKEHQS